MKCLLMVVIDNFYYRFLHNKQHIHHKQNIDIVFQFDECFHTVLQKIIRVLYNEDLTVSIGRWLFKVLVIKI